MGKVTRRIYPTSSIIKNQIYVLKQSKIYLGITTCLLAVAAVYATRAHRSATRATCYYLNPLFCLCTVTLQGSFFTLGNRTPGNGFTKKATNGLSATCYSANNTARCKCTARPLYTAAFD
jgi:hypothetical protein